jgi:glycosyltransferase involved in cell wall biosynthesis
MKAKTVLITGPSLDVKQNVSGISTLVADIVHSSRYEVYHFRVGSRDGIRKDFLWAITQPFIFFRLIYTSVIRGFKIVHLNVGLEKFAITRDAVLMMFLKTIFRKKVILHVHGGYYLMHEPEQTWLRYALKKLFRNADSIIVLSELEEKILRERFGDLNFFVFPNAVDTSILPAGTVKVLREEVKFIFMGRVNRSKGIYTISEAMKYLRNYYGRFSFEVYGNGPDLESWLQDLSRCEGLNYTYHGVISGNDKWKVLSMSDVFLLPALHSEGMPIAMIEAMAARCAVIVTDVASIGTIITDQSNGILLKQSSSVLLAAAMAGIIEGKYDHKAIGIEAEKYVRSNHSLAGYISRLDKLYETL